MPTITPSLPNISIFWFRPAIRGLISWLLALAWVFVLSVQLCAQEKSGNEVLKGIMDGLFQNGNNSSAPNAQRQFDFDEPRQLPRSRHEIITSFAPLVKRVAPAVVNVYAARNVKRQSSPFEGDPFFERFFGDQVFGNVPRQRVSRSLGSGVIINENGLIITNNHVIENADEVRVALTDGRELKAEILLADKRADLAILKVSAKEKFPFLELGNSDKLEVGDLVLAIGNPFGVGQTVTSGIVSALARSRGGVSDFGFFIQTDAAINPGNSGGALIDMRGRLIGVNTAIFSRSGGSNGIGFAIPSKMVEVVIRSVEQGSKRLLRPWIGATFQTVTSEIAESLGMRTAQGALVAEVFDNSPAKKAGLKVGDVVIKVDRQSIEHVGGLGFRLETAGIGKTVILEVISRGKRKKLSIILAAAPETVPRDERIIKGRSPFAGAKVVNISPAIAQEIGINPDAQGVIVLSVGAGSLAQRFGIRHKDIIRQVNRERVTSTKQLDEISQRGADIWRYVLERNGRLVRQVVR